MKYFAKILSCSFVFFSKWCDERISEPWELDWQCVRDVCKHAVRSVTQVTRMWTGWCYFWSQGAGFGAKTTFFCSTTRGRHPLKSHWLSPRCGHRGCHSDSSGWQQHTRSSFVLKFFLPPFQAGKVINYPFIERSSGMFLGRVLSTESQRSDVPAPSFCSGTSWLSLRWKNDSRLQTSSSSSEWLWECWTPPEVQRGFPGGWSSAGPGIDPVHHSSPWSLDFHRWRTVQSWACPWACSLSLSLFWAPQGGWWRRASLWWCHRSDNWQNKCVVRNTQLWQIFIIYHLPALFKKVMLHPRKCTCWDSLCFSTSPKLLLDPSVSAASGFRSSEDFWSLKTDRPQKFVRIGMKQHVAITIDYSSLKNNQCCSEVKES